jgi:hypothetical protein
MVSVEKYCTIARSGFIPCSLWYSYKYIVARNAGTYPSRFSKGIFLCSNNFVFSRTSDCFRNITWTGVIDAKTNSQSPKIEYILDIYFAAAALEDHFAHQYRNQSLNCIVFLFGTWIAQSSGSHSRNCFRVQCRFTTAKYFISNGTFSFAKASSKEENNIQK